MGAPCVESTRGQAVGSTASRPTIATLELAPEARPDWVGDTDVLRVPVPPATPAPLESSDVLAWARFDAGRRLPLVAQRNGELRLAFSWPAWRSYVQSEQYAHWRRRPLHTRGPISYRWVPARFRDLFAGRMCRAYRRDTAAFPSLPYDGGFEAIRGLVARFAPRPVPDPPPRIVLTHDIDTADGFDFVESIARVERDLGLRSSWNVVVREYRTDYGILDRLVERGFEIGLHDYYHDNKLVYLSEPEMRRRLDACRGFIDRYAVRGFRSPSWLRSPMLMRILADYVHYDCSCLDFDWLSPVGRGGVLTATPFRFGPLVEIPTTLPIEAPFTAGVAPQDVPAYWSSKIAWLKQVHGQAVVITHPDPHYLGNEPMLRAYRVFLETLLEVYDGRWSLPRVLAEELPADA